MLDFVVPSTSSVDTCVGFPKLFNMNGLYQEKKKHEDDWQRGTQ